MSLALIAVLGVVAGWYANMIADRVPVGQPFSEPPTCPGCQQPLPGRANVPLLGWFLVGGQCPTCSRPIPRRYPLVEGVTGAVFVLTAERIGLNWLLPAYLVFMLVTMTLILTDLDWKRIPNVILFRGGGVAGLLLIGGSLVEGLQGRLPMAIAGGFIHFGFMLIVAIIARGGMGMGDVKLAALLGVFTAYISWSTLIVSMISGILLGGLVGIVLLVTRSKGRKDEVPYGPPLILGAWLAIIWGRVIGPWMFGG